MQVGKAGQPNAILQLFRTDGTPPGLDQLARLSRQFGEAREQLNATPSRTVLAAQSSIVSGLVLSGDDSNNLSAIMHRQLDAENEAFWAKWEGRALEMMEESHLNSYLNALAAPVGYSAPADRGDAISFASMGAGHMVSAVRDMNYYASLGEVNLEQYIAEQGERMGRAAFEYDSGAAKKFERARQDFEIGQGILRSMYGLAGDYLVQGEDGRYSVKPFEIRRGDDLLLAVRDKNDLQTYY